MMMMSLKIDTLQPNIKCEVEIDSSITNPHTKCGLIFLNNQEFLYFCIYCEKQFENAKLFESHMIGIHMDEMQLAPIENIEEIYKFPEDIKLMDNYTYLEDDNSIINSNIDDENNPSFISNTEKENNIKDDSYCNKKKLSSMEDSNCDNTTDDSSPDDIHKEDSTIIKEFSKPQFKLLGPGPFTCGFCSKILKNQHTYRIHINLQHSGLGPFKCSICAHSMKTKLNLDNHIKRVHKNIDAPIYRCNYCELGFTSDSKLTLHVHKTHTFEKTFTCKICGKNFMNMGNLKTHEHIHSGIKPFQCEICGKKFIRSNNMDVHKRRHLSIRNIKCKLCNKMFYTRTSMQDHLISHTNEKKFTCDYCSTKFARKGDKLKHIQMKHPEFLSNDQKKYVCNICNADFALRVSFRQHMKSQHSVTLGNLNDSTIPKDY